MLLELVTGMELPTQDKTDQWQLVRKQTFIQQELEKSGCNLKLKGLIAACMHDDPSKRPGSSSLYKKVKGLLEKTDAPHEGQLTPYRNTCPERQRVSSTPILSGVFRISPSFALSRPITSKPGQILRL